MSEDGEDEGGGGVTHNGRFSVLPPPTAPQEKGVADRVVGAPDRAVSGKVAAAKFAVENASKIRSW